MTPDLTRASKIEAELKQFDTDNADDLVVYAEGIVHASVCSSLTKDEVVARMAKRFSGTTHGGWELSDKDFATGEPQGTPCNDKPTTHKHWLFNC